MDKIEPYFGVFWGAREQTLGQFINKTSMFLRGLQAMHPIFENLFVLGSRANEEKRLGPLLENLEPLALERAWSKKTPKAWFTQLDSEGQPTSESQVDVGWVLSVVNELESSRTESHVNLSIHAGSTADRANANAVVLQVDGASNPLMDPELSERVFLYMIDFWEADRALVTEERFRDVVGDDLTREQLGWLNYRADPGFARFLPGKVSRESCGSGILFRIGDGRALSENDQREVATGLEIQAALRA